MLAILVEAGHLPTAEQGFKGSSDIQDAGAGICDALTINLDIKLRFVEPEIAIEIHEARIFLRFLQKCLNIIIQCFV